MLRACLASPDIAEVRAVLRRPTGIRHAKLREVVHDDYLDYTTITAEFGGIDACFFCLGVSVSQVPVEADYRRIHQAFPVAAAKRLREQSPSAVFHYLSGASTALDSRWMWARVKAEAERDLMNGFDALCWRPAMIGGTPGSNPPLYLTILRPILTPLFRPFRGFFIDSDDIGRAMITATMRGLRRRIVENREMRDLADAWRDRPSATTAAR